MRFFIRKDFWKLGEFSFPFKTSLNDLIFKFPKICDLQGIFLIKENYFILKYLYKNRYSLWAHWFQFKE